MPTARKRRGGALHALTRPKRKQLEGDEIESSDDEIIRKNGGKEKSDDEIEDVETAQEKRFRLAKEYLSQMKKQEQELDESKDVDHDAISHRLKEDVLAKSGRLQRKIADKVSMPSTSDIKIMRGHKLSPTCVVTTSDGSKCVSGSKDGSIVVWDIKAAKRLKTVKGVTSEAGNLVKGHKGQVLCLAVSDDSKFLCSGGSDSFIRVWDFGQMTLLKEFTGHKGAITGLSFRQGQHQLFSCAEDRSVKVWSLDEMGYVDTMFGHQDSITAIDSLARERAITCGGRDRTIRIWKMVEESQLVFNAHSSCGSIECLSLINEDHFLSGSDNNAISLWSVMKKKPACMVQPAHGASISQENQRWITCIVAAKFTDLVASGSNDGFVRLWKCAENYKSLDLLHAIPMPGFINGLSFSPDYSSLICAVGQEHRLGRWWRIKDAKNSICVIPLEMVQEEKYLWIPRKKNYGGGDEKNFFRLCPVLSHPLKVVYSAKSEIIDKEATDFKTSSKSTLSSKSASTASLTKCDEKSSAKSAKELPKFIDPLGATFDGSTLNGENLDILAIKPVKRELKRHEFDKIANTLLNDNSKCRHKKYEFDEFEPWLLKKGEILKKFVTNEKLSIVTSFLPGGVPIHSQVASSEVRLRLEQLDSFHDASVPKRIQNLSQKDYIEKINELTKALIKAWSDDQRVQAIKIVIQCAKFLADTSSVPRFYPSQFVLVVEVLDTFGRLVYERLEQKVIEESGFKDKSSLDWKKIHGVPEGAKEIARNWFYKVASIRELLPRFYVECALLPVYRFLSAHERRRSISRLVESCRGLADPLAACYARCYLLKMAFTVEPIFVEPSWRCFHDFMAILCPMGNSGGLTCETANGRVKSNVEAQSQSANGILPLPVDSGNVHPGPSSGFVPLSQEKRELLVPAFEFLVQCLMHGSSREDRAAILGCCEQRRDPLVTTCVLRSMPQKFVSESVLDCIKVVKSFFGADSDKHSEESDASRLYRCRWTCDALGHVGEAVCNVEPPPDEVPSALKDAWRLYRRFVTSHPALCAPCACAWLRFAARHFGVREVSVLLADLTPAMRADRLYEKSYEILMDVLKDIVQFLVPKFGLMAVVSMQNFTAFMDLFERPDVKASAAEVLLNFFCMQSQSHSGDFDDPSLANHCLNFCSSLFHSLDVASPPDQQRRVAQKICRSLQRFEAEDGEILHEDFERQLVFFVEARGRFCRTSFAGDLVAAHLCHAVSRLCARLAAKRTDLYVAACTSSDSQSMDDVARSSLAFLFVTAPSVSDYFVRLRLYVEGACVAAMTNCPSQRDAFLRVVISTLAERPLNVAVTSDSDTKRHYASAAAQVLSLLLHVAEDDTDRQPLYFFRALLNAVRKQQWEEDELDCYVKLLLDCLSFLAVSVQSRGDCDENDDQFTAVCATIGGEILGESLECLQTLLLKHDKLFSKASSVVQSQRRPVVDAAATSKKVAVRLCADLADLIVARCDVPSSLRLGDLVASLWTQALRNDVGRTLDGRLAFAVERVKLLSADDAVYCNLAQKLAGI